jgi:predicted oxidoreductase
VGSKWLPKTVKTVLNYEYSKVHHLVCWEFLKNLQTDYLDVFLLHRPSPLMRADEIAEAVLKLQSDGKLLMDCLILLPHKLN